MGGKMTSKVVQWRQKGGRMAAQWWQNGGKTTTKWRHICMILAVQRWKNSGKLVANCSAGHRPQLGRARRPLGFYRVICCFDWHTRPRQDTPGHARTRQDTPGHTNQDCTCKPRIRPMVCLCASDNRHWLARPRLTHPVPHPLLPPSAPHSNPISPPSHSPSTQHLPPPSTLHWHHETPSDPLQPLKLKEVCSGEADTTSATRLLHKEPRHLVYEPMGLIWTQTTPGARAQIVRDG
jgi:hypothetical protein